nr:immunoglobulin heavy chain junction region [Mus musculus]
CARSETYYSNPYAMDYW